MRLRQRDPVVEYRNEGYDMFDQMIANIRDDKYYCLFLIRKIRAIDEQEVPRDELGSKGKKRRTLTKKRNCICKTIRAKVVAEMIHVHAAVVKNIKNAVVMNN